MCARARYGCRYAEADAGLYLSMALKISVGWFSISTHFALDMHATANWHIAFHPVLNVPQGYHEYKLPVYPRDPKALASLFSGTFFIWIIPVDIDVGCRVDLSVTTSFDRAVRFTPFKWSMDASLVRVPSRPSACCAVVASACSACGCVCVFFAAQRLLCACCVSRR